MNPHRKACVNASMWPMNFLQMVRSLVVYNWGLSGISRAVYLGRIPCLRLSYCWSRPFQRDIGTRGRQQPCVYVPPCALGPSGLCIARYCSILLPSGSGSAFVHGVRHALHLNRFPFRNCCCVYIVCMEKHIVGLGWWSNGSSAACRCTPSTSHETLTVRDPHHHHHPHI